MAQPGGDDLPNWSARPSLNQPPPTSTQIGAIGNSRRQSRQAGKSDEAPVAASFSASLVTLPAHATRTRCQHPKPKGCQRQTPTDRPLSSGVLELFTGIKIPVKQHTNDTERRLPALNNRATPPRRGTAATCSRSARVQVLVIPKHLLDCARRAPAISPHLRWPRHDLSAQHVWWKAGMGAARHPDVPKPAVPPTSRRPAVGSGAGAGRTISGSASPASRS